MTLVKVKTPNAECENMKTKFNFIEKLFGKYLAGSGYKCIRKLGSGSYGESYLIENHKGYKMVIKAIFTKHANNIHIMKEAEILEILEDECSKKRVLCHNTVIEYKENGKRGVFLLSEYIKGVDMFTYYYTDFKRQGLEKATCRIILQFLDSIEYIHSKNVVHLDIKPENVMITNKGDLKLIDFGGAAYSPKHTNVDHHTMTRQYIPPGATKENTSYPVAVFRDYYAFIRSMRHDGPTVISPMDVVLKNTKASSKFKKLYELFDIYGITDKNYKRRISDIKRLTKECVLG